MDCCRLPNIDHRSRIRRGAAQRLNKAIHAGECHCRRHDISRRCRSEDRSTRMGRGSTSCQVLMHTPHASCNILGSGRIAEEPRDVENECMANRGRLASPRKDSRGGAERVLKPCCSFCSLSPEPVPSYLQHQPMRISPHSFDAIECVNTAADVDWIDHVLVSYE